MSDGKRPVSVGFFFSLGHSTVVFVLAFLFAIGIRTLGGQVANSDSTLHEATTWIGTGVSATFLYLLAALNMVILCGIIKVFRELRSGRFDEAELERQLRSRGLMNRLFGRFANAISEPWQMSPVGLLFASGDGLDAAVLECSQLRTGDDFARLCARHGLLLLAGELVNRRMETS